MHQEDASSEHPYFNLNVNLNLGLKSQCLQLFTFKLVVRLWNELIRLWRSKVTAKGHTSRLK